MDAEISEEKSKISTQSLSFLIQLLIAFKTVDKVVKVKSSNDKSHVNVK
jgi:hypothetical protein